MSFNEQPNMFFAKIISYTCDLHLFIVYNFTSIWDQRVH
jgi:hypothetical protein